MLRWLKRQTRFGKLSPSQQAEALQALVAALVLTAAALATDPSLDSEAFGTLAACVPQLGATAAWLGTVDAALLPALGSAATTWIALARLVLQLR